MTISIRTGILTGGVAAGLMVAASAFAQTTTAPSGTDCSSASAATSQPCQNQLNQPGMINNNTQTPTQQTLPTPAGPQGGSSGLGGGSSGGALGGSGGSAGGSSGGGVGGGSSGGGSGSN